MKHREKMKQHFKDGTEFKWQHGLCPAPGPMYIPGRNSCKQWRRLGRKTGASPSSRPHLIVTRLTSAPCWQWAFPCGLGSCWGRRWLLLTHHGWQTGKSTVINYSVLERNFPRFSWSRQQLFSYNSQEFESCFFVHVLIVFTNLTIKLLSEYVQVCICIHVHIRLWAKSWKYNIKQ